MEKLLKLLRENWEKSVLALVLLAVVVTLVVFFSGDGEVSGVSASGKKILSRPKALSENAFSFLSPVKAAYSRNPFEQPGVKPPAPKPQPVAQPPKQVVSAPTPAPAPVVKQEEPKAEQEVVEEVKPAQEAAPQIVGGAFGFRFQRRNSDGKTVAIVSVQLMGESARSMTVSVGDIVNGVKILAISEERIGLQDARMNRGTIPLGETRNIWYSK